MSEGKKRKVHTAEFKGPREGVAKGRVESSRSAALPHQTVHALLTHTAFRCCSVTVSGLHFCIFKILPKRV